MQLLFLNVLVRGVRDMNGSRPDQQGLTPVAQRWNVGSESGDHSGQIFERAQADEGNLESEFNFGQIADGLR